LVARGRIAKRYMAEPMAPRIDAYPKLTIEGVGSSNVAKKEQTFVDDTAATEIYTLADTLPLLEALPMGGKAPTADRSAIP
jgi:hypothetical protein